MRHYGCIPDLVGADRGRRFSLAAPTLSASQLPEESNDLSLIFKPRISQYSEGCCVAHGITSALRYNWVNDGEPDMLLSRNQLYYDTRKREGTTASDAGCQIHNAIAVAQEVGICQEGLWPYDLTKWMDAPPDSVYSDANKHTSLEPMSVDVDPLAIRTALMIGKVVVLGISVFPSFEDESVTQTGFVPMPGSAERVLSGHCLVAYRRTSTGYRPNGIGKPGIHCWNWWQEYDPATGEVTERWGQDGDCVLPETYFVPEYAADLWSLLRTSELAVAA